MMTASHKEHIKTLCQKLTHTGRKELAQNHLMELERILHERISSMEYVFHLLMEYLEKPHSEIRYGAFMLCDHFFRKYEIFRQLMNEELPQLIVRTVGSDETQPLPPPKAAAKALRQLALFSILDWNQEFGLHYYELKMAYQFLQNCVKVDLNTIEKEREMEAAKNRENKSKMEAEKRLQLKNTFLQINEYFAEIESCCTSLQNCLKIVLPPQEELACLGLFHDPNVPTTTTTTRSCESEMTVSFHTKAMTATITSSAKCFTTVELRENGMLNAKHSVLINMPPAPAGIEVTDDNEVIILNAREGYRLITKRYLPQVKAWQKVLDAHKDAKCEKREAVSELLRCLLKLVQKCKVLKIIDPATISDDAEDTSDDDLQEVEPKAGYEASVGDALLAELVRQREEQRLQQPQKSVCTPQPGPSRPAVQQTALPRNIEAWQGKELPQGAPYIRISEKPDTNQVWLSAASGSQAEEAAAPQVTSIPIEFPSTSDPVKWSCRVPLPSGRLCPRMDRHKCPLHGPVLPRDEQGRCTRPEDAQAEEKRRLLHQQQHPDWQEPKFLAELEKQIGIDLKMPVKGQRKKKAPEFPGLTDLKRKADTPRARLAKKIMKKYNRKKP